MRGLEGFESKESGAERLRDPLYSIASEIDPKILVENIDRGDDYIRLSVSHPDLGSWTVKVGDAESSMLDVLAGAALKNSFETALEKLESQKKRHEAH